MVTLVPYLNQMHTNDPRFQFTPQKW